MMWQPYLICLLTACTFLAGCGGLAEPLPNNSSSSSSGSTAGARGLNDTGFTLCGNNSANNLACTASATFPNQDALSGRDANPRLQKIGAGRSGFDFIKLDAAGNPLPASALVWSCVKDNHTGLIWEVKNNHSDSLHYSLATFSWYNIDPRVNAGVPGKANNGQCLAGISCDTASYVTAVNGEKTCGRNNWRLPEREELRSIIDYSLNRPSIDTQYFAYTQNDGYWTATASTADNAWHINFFIGSSQDVYKGYAYFVLLVAGE